MHGAETELDRQVLDLIKDPLTHMVRNSADHGLETPAERRAAGKPETGTIRLSACHEGGHIIIEIADDGRGLDTDADQGQGARQRPGRRSRARQDVGSADPQVHLHARLLDRREGHQRVRPRRRHGRRAHQHRPDRRHHRREVGAAARAPSFTIKIPLTLAIVSALIVEAGGERFAIPQLSVVELVRARSNSEHRIERIKDAAGAAAAQQAAAARPASSSLLKLDDGADGDAENGFIVVTQVGSQTFGIVVDGVFHTEEIVVKPMSSKLRHIPMFSGNTILGDGSVIMIIDPNGIAADGRHGAATAPGDGRRARRRAPGREATTESLLVFRAGSPQPKAVPLSLVTRLEEIDAKTIELVERPPPGAVPRPAHAAGAGQRRRRASRASGTQPLLVFSDDGRSMGLVVDEIVDIVEDRLDIEVGERHARRSRLGGDQGPGDRDHRHRPLSCRSPSRTGCARKEHAADAATRTRAARRRLRRSSATC